MIEGLEINRNSLTFLQLDKFRIIVDYDFRGEVDLEILFILGVFFIGKRGEKEELHFSSFIRRINFNIFELGVSILDLLLRGALDTS